MIRCLNLSKEIYNMVETQQSNHQILKKKCLLLHKKHKAYLLLFTIYTDEKFILACFNTDYYGITKIKFSFIYDSLIIKKSHCIITARIVRQFMTDNPIFRVKTETAVSFNAGIFSLLIDSLLNKCSSFCSY